MRSMVTVSLYIIWTVNSSSAPPVRAGQFVLGYEWRAPLTEQKQN